MTKITSINKTISFKTDDDNITNILVMATEFYGLITYQIKFSIKYGDMDERWYLINNIDPLKVFGGLAGTFIQSSESIVCMEYEVINFVISKMPKDFYEMAEQSKLVKRVEDYY